jgi:hypothetical protein
MEALRFGWGWHAHIKVEEAVIKGAKHPPLQRFLTKHQQAIHQASTETDLVNRGPHHYINLRMPRIYGTNDHQLPPNPKELTPRERATFALTTYIKHPDGSWVSDDLKAQLQQTPLSPVVLDSMGEKTVFATVQHRHATLASQVESLQQASEQVQQLGKQVLASTTKLVVTNKNLAPPLPDPLVVTDALALMERLTKQVINTTGRIFHLGADANQPQHVGSAPIHDYKLAGKGTNGDRTSHKAFETFYPTMDPDYADFSQRADRVLATRDQPVAMTPDALKGTLAKQIQHAHLQLYHMLEADSDARKVARNPGTNTVNPAQYAQVLQQRWHPIAQEQMLAAVKTTHDVLCSAWLNAEANVAHKQRKPKK